MGNGNSVLYFIDLVLELQIDTTLGTTTPTNPLNTELALIKNIEDPENKIRESLKAQINSLLPFAIPSGDLLNSDVSNAFLCWLRQNNNEFNDISNDWAEGLKYGLTNVNDLSDADKKTDMKYIIFLEYVRLNTRRYFKRTRESALFDEYVPSSYKSIRDTYNNFRKYNFDQIYKPLRNDLFPTLYKNGINGWQDVLASLQNSVLLPFRNLTTDVTYGDFLNNIDAIITNLHEFLMSEGPLGDFLVNQYAPQVFAGQNVCNFDSKLQCLLCKLQQVPSTTGATIMEFSKDNGGGTTVTSYNPDRHDNNITNGPTRSLTEAISNVILTFIFHLFDKFAPYQGYPATGTALTNNIITNGGNVLLRLMLYIYGVDNSRGVYNMISKSCEYTDHDIDLLLGDAVIAPTSPNSTLQSGALHYITATLRTLLSSSADIVLYPFLDPNIAPTALARISSSYFSGAFQVDWLNQTMSDSTINNPPKFSLSSIMMKKPQNICSSNRKSLETEILELMDNKNLDQVLGAYVCTFVNHIEGLNLPSQSAYIDFTLTGANPITSYDQVTFTDFSVAYTDDVPNSYQDFKFLCECCDSCELIPTNSNIKCTKYYCIALVNYILYSIIRMYIGVEIPKLVLDDLIFPFNSLSLTSPQNYTYISGSFDTEILIMLFYMTNSWNEILYSEFFGPGAYFDPINLSDQLLCVQNEWTTTPLVQQLFYLFYKYDPEFLRLMISDTTTLVASGSTTKNTSNLRARTAFLEKVTKINN